MKLFGFVYGDFKILINPDERDHNCIVVERLFDCTLYESWSEAKKIIDARIIGEKPTLRDSGFHDMRVEFINFLKENPRKRYHYIEWFANAKS